MRLKLRFPYLLLLLSLFALSAASFLPAFHFSIELLHNFGFYLLIGHAVLFFSLLASSFQFCSKALLVTSHIFFIAYFSYPLWNLYLEQNVPVTSNAQEVDIVYANLKAKIADGAGTRNTINERKPTILALVDVDSVWLKTLNLESDYPFRIETPKAENFNLVLYSQYPLKLKPDSNFGEELVAHIVVEIELGESRIAKLILLKGVPPHSAAAVRHNRLLFRRLATYARNHRENIIVMGDFNATFFSDNYKKLTTWAGMQNIASGAGLDYLWNFASRPFILTTDHVLVKGRLQVKDVQILGSVATYVSIQPY